VLEAAEGTSTREIARELDTTPTTVSLWRGRFARQGLDGLEDLSRCGTPPIYGEGTDNRIRSVLDQPPPPGFARRTFFSSRARPASRRPPMQRRRNIETSRFLRFWCAAHVLPLMQLCVEPRVIWRRVGIGF
jgi:hypothetical protein